MEERVDRAATQIPGEACPVCGLAGMKLQVCVANYPVYLSALPAHLASGVARANLTLLACERCGHFFKAAPDAQLQKLIYETYYTHYLQDAEESHHPHYRKPFNDTVSSLADAGVLPRGRLLEIGCSTGEQVPFFSAISESYVGLDPSERIEHARSRFPAARFVRGYFPAAIEGELFDVVVAQFLLEHTEDPAGFLRAVFDSCTSNAVLLIQVPDIDCYLNARQPIYLAHEHIQYFRRSQLQLLLERQGFDPIAWADPGPSLICAAKRGPAAGREVTPVEPEPLAAARRCALIFENRPRLPDGAIAFYGVGPILHWILQDVPRSQRVAVLVDNPACHGWAVPAYNYNISPPSAEMLKTFPDVVLTLNRIYHQSVLSRLRGFGVPLRVHLNSGEKWEVLHIEA